ncbi:MAG: hypothetical protein IPO37_17875 [Saprospiraceae bacterium]|nr:hypothetical protein [Saprospiraceae bacterium]
MRLRITLEHKMVSSYHGTINTPSNNGSIRRYPRQMTLLATTVLHDHGYVYEGKSFKLFSFGPWRSYPYDKIKDMGMKFRTSKPFLETLVLPSVLSTFVSGLFQDQKHTLLQKKYNDTRADFSTEILTEPIF